METQGEFLDVICLTEHDVFTIGLRDLNGTMHLVRGYHANEESQADQFCSKLGELMELPVKKGTIAKLLEDYLSVVTKAMQKKSGGLC